MLRACKYRAYPTKKERKALNYQMSLAKELYNLLLSKAKEYYKETGKTLTRYKMNKMITEIKEGNGEFDRVYSQVLQNVADRVSKAYSNFFGRVKARRTGVKIRAGFPREKTFVTSLTYPQFGFTLQERSVGISLIGKVPIVVDRKADGDVKTMTIKKEKSGKWHVTFVSDIKDAKVQQNDRPQIGIDLGINNYATLSNGIKIENPRFGEIISKKMGKLHRQISRKKKGSMNRRKSVIKLARLSEHLAMQRNDYLNKLSHNLVNSYSMIAYEELKVADMVYNSYLSRGIYDASWSQFIRMLCYKAESAGCRAIGVDPKNTTKTCSNCNNVQKMSLSDRIYECRSCGISIDRDLNASINILKIATVGHTGSDAFGEVASTTAIAVASGFDELGTILGSDADGNPHL